MQTRYKSASLQDISDKTDQNQTIEISNNSSVQKLLVIKRDGSKQEFDVNKLKAVVDWATDYNEHFTEELLRDTDVKLHNEIKVTDMYKQLIVTSVNKISLLYPQWEFISARLQLLEYYKEIAGISERGDYTHLKDVLSKGVQHHIYDHETIDKL